jgi:hypothetical protein
VQLGGLDRPCAGGFVFGGAELAGANCSQDCRLGALRCARRFAESGGPAASSRPDDVGESRHWSECWWRLLRPWPAGLRFEDAARVEVTAGGQLPPRPPSAGLYGCAAALCADDGEVGG